MSIFPYVSAIRLRSESAARMERLGYVLTASTPSPLRAAANPACFRRSMISLGTSRPLVSLFGAPV